jgi:predicted Zn-dependent protease
MAGGQFVNMGFTRHDEDEADKLGFDFYTRAGWDPNKFDDFFQQMIDQGLDTTPEMMSDHPSLKNRVTATKERVKKLPPTAPDWRRPPIASPEQFKALQARAAELGKSLPSDATLSPGSQQLLAALPRSCLTPVVQPDEIKARENLAKQAEEAQKKQQSGQGAQPQQTAPAKKNKQQSAAAAPARAPSDAVPAGTTLPPSQQVISSPR